MLRIFTTLAICLITQFIFAQSAKTSVAIFPFTSALPENKGRSAQIQQIVIEILKNKSDIELIDRSADSMLLKELDNQIREQSIAANGLVQQGKLLGAKQMITGTVSNVACEQKTTNGINPFNKKATSSTEYDASVSFALTLTDVETGAIVNQKSLNSKEANGGKLLSFLNLGTGSTKEEAILNAIKSTKGLILAWINESYPPEIKILSIEDRDKKGFPSTVLVSGVDATLQRGSKFIINEIEMFDAGNGKSLRRTKKIAELKVKEKQGEITVCNVTDGEKVLEEKMKAGTKMELKIK